MCFLVVTFTFCSLGDGQNLGRESTARVGLAPAECTPVSRQSVTVSQSSRLVNPHWGFKGQSNPRLLWTTPYGAHSLYIEMVELAPEILRHAFRPAEIAPSRCILLRGAWPETWLRIVTKLRESMQSRPCLPCMNLIARRPTPTPYHTLHDAYFQVFRVVVQQVHSQQRNCFIRTPFVRPALLGQSGGLRGE